MNMQEVRTIARDNGIKSGKLSKTVLIRTIQECEGNYSCFATEKYNGCDQMDCLWRDDCFTSAKRALKM